MLPPYGKPPNVIPKIFVLGGDAVGVLLFPVLPPLTAGAKGLKEDDAGDVSVPGSRLPLKPPRPPNELELDEGEVPPLIESKKLEVVPVGLVLLPTPKPPKVGAGLGAEPEPDDTTERKVGAGFGADGCEPAAI